MPVKHRGRTRRIQPGRYRVRLSRMARQWDAARLASTSRARLATAAGVGGSLPGVEKVMNLDRFDLF